MKKILLAILILAMAFPAYGRRTEKGGKTIDPRESGWIRDSRTGVVSPLVPGDKIVFGDYSSYGTGTLGTETDPVAMPVLANVSSQLNSLETSFTNFTGNVDAKTLNGLPDTSFMLLSTFTSTTTIFSNYSAINNKNQIICDATADDIDIYIVSASGVVGQRIGNVKKIDASGNSCCIDPAGAETIDGVAARCITTRNENITYFTYKDNLLIK
jgi:hypothetical protein